MLHLEKRRYILVFYCTHDNALCCNKFLIFVLNINRIIIFSLISN